jgi:dienelactone hydrolase
VRKALLALLFGLLALPALAGVERRDVRFPSSSPFVIRDIGEAPPTEAVATLFRPTAAAGRRPAVVILHGAAGVRDARELAYGAELAEHGTIALVIDAFRARDGFSVGFTDRLLRITETMMLADAYNGLRWLAARDDVDPARVVLLGFSYGGMASVIGANEAVRDRLAPPGLRFAGHVSFYGPCVSRFEDPRTTGAPVLMLLGDADENVPVARCREVAADLERGGSAVQVEVYAGAAHQWDNPYPGRRRMELNMAGCDLAIERDGTVRDRFTQLPMLGLNTRRLILFACVTREGYDIAGDAAIKRRSDADLGRFLQKVLGG